MRKPDVPSIIASGVVVDGNVSSDGEIRVDGKINGNITCKILVVGTNGAIDGDVSAETAKIHGILNGKLVARSVVFGSTARMKGDVEHELLAIEPGAYVEGHCHRSGDPIIAKGSPEDLMITDARKKQ
ncbi:hypothetical protein FACS1894186_3760 [Alphaproteobacteria bacterium]|nr:hypothetical protein FACS1894186_3760 [Alphaproteobacteria bacterium]